MISQEQPMPRCAWVQAFSQIFMEYLSLDQSILLQDGEWAHLCLDCRTQWDFQQHQC